MREDLRARMQETVTNMEIGLRQLRIQQVLTKIQVGQEIARESRLAREVLKQYMARVGKDVYWSLRSGPLVDNSHPYVKITSGYPDFTKREEEALLFLVKKGDREACWTLVYFCLRYVLILARKFACNKETPVYFWEENFLNYLEAAQEELVRVVFKERLCKFQSKASTSSYIYSILSKTIIDFIRLECRHREGREDFSEKSLPVTYSQVVAGDNPLTDVVAEQICQLFVAMLSQLKGRKRELISWWFLTELTFEQIGEELGISQEAVRSDCRRLLDSLKGRPDVVRIQELLAGTEFGDVLANKLSESLSLMDG